MAAFFLPRASDDEQAERLYDALAEFAGCAPAPPGERVQAIAFTADGARWVAAVGEELRGRRTTQQLRRGELLERTEDLGSGTRVLAIYPARRTSSSPTPSRSPARRRSGPTRSPPSPTT